MIGKPIRSVEEFREILKHVRRLHEKQKLTNVSLKILSKSLG